MVEGASIDKQSHPNQASGTIWDTIEIDKAVGVVRSCDFAMRARGLPGGWVLIAVGSSKPGQTTGRLVLMRETELRHFYPRMEKDLARKGTSR